MRVCVVGGGGEGGLYPFSPISQLVGIIINNNNLLLLSFGLLSWLFTYFAG